MAAPSDQQVQKCTKYLVRNTKQKVARENEFKKLNKQLEKKTESLIKQIENDMQNLEYFSDIPQNISKYHRSASPKKKHCCNSPKSSPKSTPTKKNKFPAESPVKTSVKSAVEREPIMGQGCVTCEHCAKNNGELAMNTEFLSAFVNVNVQDNILPVSFMNETISIENVCKFLSAKVRLLQEQMEKLQATIMKKATQCEEHLLRQSDLETERLSFIINNKNLTAEIHNMRAKCAAMQVRLAEKDRLCEKQRSEVDKLGIRLRHLEKAGAESAGRAAALELAVDKLKKELEGAKTAEKEYRTASRELANTHQSAISRLESRIKGLTTRISRQAALVDNLKRQNTLLTADGAVKYLEKEYLNFLNTPF